MVLTTRTAHQLRGVQPSSKSQEEFEDHDFPSEFGSVVLEGFEYFCTT